MDARVLALAISGLLVFGAVPLQAQSPLSDYTVSPDYGQYGPGLPVEIRARLQGGDSAGYSLRLQTELLGRDWDIVVDDSRTRGSGGTPQDPIVVEVPALASDIHISLNATTPNLIRPERRLFIQIERQEAGGSLSLLKSDRRDVGPVTVTATPAPSPTPTPTPAPSPSPPPPTGTLKVVLEPPEVDAAIYMDGRRVGNGSYTNESVPLGQYLVSFGPAEGYRAPEPRVVSLTEAQPSVFLRGVYQALAAPTPPESTPTPTPPPTPEPAAPGVPMGVVAGVAVLLVALGVAVRLARRRKGGPPPTTTPETPDSGPPSTEMVPPAEPAEDRSAPADVSSGPRDDEAVPEGVSLETLRDKRQRLESRSAQLEEEMRKGGVSSEEYEERKKRYERQLREIEKEMAKRSG